MTQRGTQRDKFGNYGEELKLKIRTTMRNVNVSFQSSNEKYLLSGIAKTESPSLKHNSQLKIKTMIH